MASRWLGPGIVGLVAAAMAWQGTMLAVPRALMLLAERKIGSVAGVNTMVAGPLVTAASRAIVRPSPDLLYSTCVFNLSAGPVLVDVPPISAPYWSLSVFDRKTDVAFVRNNRQSGGAAIRVAILAEGQAAPAGYTPVPVIGHRGVALVRVLIDRTKPIDSIDVERRKANCRAA
ncbi:MAG: DUF1254 domain-containing protein [Sphingomonas sp.]